MTKVPYINIEPGALGYADYSDLINSEEKPRGTGAIWEYGGHRAEEVTSGEHFTIPASGVKLKVLPGADGLVPVEALGLDDTGATDVTTKMQAALDSADGLLVPVGTFWARLTITTPKTILGVDQERSVITSEPQSAATTLTVNAKLTLRNLTINSHKTASTGITISHAGANTVVADHVTFDGCNHTLAQHVNGDATYRHCRIISYAAPDSLGALCHSAGAQFWNCDFAGGRAIEAKDSKFYSCRVVCSGNAVHIPDGALGNDGLANGFTGISEWYDCWIETDDTGMTCGNAGHPKLRRTTIIAGKVGSGKQAFYARSASTIDAEDCTFISDRVSGTAVSFSDLQGPGNIARAGESVMKRCRMKGDFTSLSIPTTSDAYPASIGNLLLVDCEVVGGDDEISPNTSTYHIFQTERFLEYTSSVEFTANDTTKRLRYKSSPMLVTVRGSDAAKTGCHLSHLDEVTGDPLPDGMEIWLRYGGVSSRFVTFANGATDDGGSMYFANDASTLQVTQQGIYKFRLQGTTWRQA